MQENTVNTVQMSQQADHRKGSKTIIIILGILVILALLAVTAFTAYIYGKNQGQEEGKDQKDDTQQADDDHTSETQTSSTTTTTISESTDPYEGWNTYTNPTYGYTLRYPQDWELDDSEEVECNHSESEEGCYPKERGTTMTITNPETDNSLIIIYEFGYASYAFDSVNNFNEEDFIFWGKEGKKGYVYCSKTNQEVNCIGSENATEINSVFYYNELISKAPDCTTCYYPEGNLKDSCEDSYEIKGSFGIGGYIKEDDDKFDLIVSSLTEPECI